MKKPIILCLMVSALCISCKEIHYTPPSLDAVRSAEKARIQWSKEVQKTTVTQITVIDTTSIQDSITSVSVKNVNTDSITSKTINQ